MTDILFVYIVGMFNVHLKLGALSAALGHRTLCRIILSIERLVLKGKEKLVSSSPSPSVIPAVSTSASVGSSPSLPSVSDNDKLRDYVHSFLSSFLSQSGSVGINPSSFSAPTVVPDSAPPVQGVAGGLGAGSLNKGRLTEPSGVVPLFQEETPPPPTPPHHNVSMHDVAYDRFGVVRVSGFHVLGLGLVTSSFSSGIDQLRVRSDSGVSSVSVSSALSLSDLLFPLSDSGFASFLCFHCSSSSFLFLFFLWFSYYCSFSSSYCASLFSSYSCSFCSVIVFVCSSSFCSFSPSSSWFSSCFCFRGLCSLCFLVQLCCFYSFLPFALCSYSWGFCSSFLFCSFGSLFPSSLFLSFISSASSSSSSFLDFASFQARTLGLSVEYQTLACWFVQSGWY